MGLLLLTGLHTLGSGSLSDLGDLGSGDLVIDLASLNILVDSLLGLQVFDLLLPLSSASSAQDLLTASFDLLVGCDDPDAPPADLFLLAPVTGSIFTFFSILPSFVLLDFDLAFIPPLLVALPASLGLRPVLQLHLLAASAGVSALSC